MGNTATDVTSPAVGTQDDLALQRSRARSREQGTNGSETAQPICARLLASSAARERLLDAVGSGKDDFLVVSGDGDVAVRVHLAIESLDIAEEAIGGSGVVVDWQRSTVANRDSRVRLAPSELRLLAALLEARGQAVPRGYLASRVWAGADANAQKENGLPVYIWMLRKRLAAIGLGNALQTVRGMGYRFRV